MQTRVKAIEVIDRNGNGSETKMLSIRMENGELKSHRLRRLLRDGEVRRFSVDLVWDLTEEIKRLAMLCDEVPFPDMSLAGSLAYLADNPEDAIPAPMLLTQLLNRRDELTKKHRAMTGWTQEDAWKRAKTLCAR